MTGDLIEATAAAARDVLRSCSTPYGLRASARDNGYPEVWTRDTAISLLGICADGFEEVVPALEVSLSALTRAQSTLGYVPLNVDPLGQPTTANAGSIDSNLWYVIAHWALHRTFGVADLLERHRDALARAMLWVRYQDSDNDGLLESQEAADWADLLANRGKVLYTNVLYILALRAYAGMAGLIGLPDGPAHEELASTISGRLNAVHWVASERGLAPAGEPADHSLAGEESRRLAWLTASQLWSRPYYLPWVAFRDFGDWCDVFGNCLAILAGVADDSRRDRILNFLHAVSVSEPVPARAIHPPIRPGDKDWREYYRNGNLSLPDQYHNGGAWPFIGGFLVAAYVHGGRLAEASVTLARLARALQSEAEPTWEFNEWHHGLTGRPMGQPFQAWSAAMFLYARRAVSQGSVPWPSERDAGVNTMDQSRLDSVAGGSPAGQRDRTSDERE